MKNKRLMLIPVVIFSYLIYLNLIPFGGTWNYYIDVGGDDLNGTARLTGPKERISEPNEMNGTTFRTLQQGLVYFQLKSPYLKDKGEVTVSVRFMDNFPPGQKFMAGTKINQSQKYVWKDIYVPFYETLKWYPFVTIDNKRAYLINESKIWGRTEKTITIATNSRLDLNLTPSKNVKIVDIKPDPVWIKNNADYIILDYNFTEGSVWKVGRVKWSLDELYIGDSTLSFGLNAPHMGKEEFRNYTIPLDRIDIVIKIPPLWERIR